MKRRKRQVISRKRQVTSRPEEIEKTHEHEHPSGVFRLGATSRRRNMIAWRRCSDHWALKSPVQVCTRGKSNRS
jgi:hypothetical protein